MAAADEALVSGDSDNAASVPHNCYLALHAAPLILVVVVTTTATLTALVKGRLKQAV